MSAQHKFDEKRYSEESPEISKKVNVRDLMAKMNESKKAERKNNIILSAAAISAVTVFGIILTL
jgi:hypothetical protein|tara:strand:+ start:953 stop:1144 length:192 start_codon:yes stop_codon:yes gene_type:complete